MTHRVWGYVNEVDRTVAAYFVEWTPGPVENAANFDFILGSWRQVIGQPTAGKCLQFATTSG
jgi:hypothetical protein